MFSFDSPENIGKPKVIWCFQGDQKGPLGIKGLTQVPKKNSESLSRNLPKTWLEKREYTLCQNEYFQMITLYQA